MNLQFSHTERLRKKEEIRNVLQQRGIRGKLIVIHILPQSGGSSRLGMVVRRTVGNAVIRNRAKRRLREVFRRIKSHLTKTVDLVVRAQNSIRDATYWEIKEELTRLLQNERLLPRTLPDTETNGLQQGSHSRTQSE